MTDRRDPTTQVSVVVPARDAADTIERAVRGVLAQAGAPAFELIVVDNASQDGTGELAARAGARVVRLDDRAGGPGRARNAGVAAATGTHVAFTDADCFPTPGWLAALWRGTAAAELVAGPVAADRTAIRGTWDRTLEYPAPTPLWATANLLVQRRVLDAAGGFDDWVADAHEAPRRPFGEDTVTAWRAIRAGARTAWAPDALVEHAVFPRDARGWILHHRDLQHMPSLVARVPELRRELLTAGVVLNAATATTTLAAASIATAVVTRRASPLLGALPWTARQVRALRQVGPRITAVRAAGEVVGAASLLVGSAQHRTPVL
ncbi:glycosyltransferase family 2 protein [Patulibacter sp.]|uniref:glycosyltransferase n=1 Tax=Patulibacter sp. TaxID=1912859 RepID=UPI002720CFC0|nr:glycosyltransferase family A protein [Patulibacter sp.]MDO9408606.1 glycosyltransferase family A protein [Patulibacter sp.]